MREQKRNYLFAALASGPSTDSDAVSTKVASPFCQLFLFHPKPAASCVHNNGQASDYMFKRLKLPVLALAGLLAVFNPVVVFGQHGGGGGGSSRGGGGQSFRGGGPFPC